MATSDEKLMAISNELNEHIIAVKGVLELTEESASEELQGLISKAIKRMDAIERLSNEVVIALKHLIDRIGEIEKKKSEQ